MNKQQNTYLTLEDILSHLQSDLEIINHISNYSILIDELDKTAIKENFWKYHLIAKELYINNLIMSDYIKKISSTTIDDLEKLLKDLQEIK